MSENNRVTVEEQERMGVLRPSKYVSAQPVVVADRRPQPRAEIMPPTNDYSVNVIPTATASVDFRTSAQDRAWGFLIASTPRTFVFALGMTLIAMLATGIGVVAGIVILISMFSVIELGSYWYTLRISAEGTAYMEAKRKWAVIEREQRARWAHYNKITKED